ncbi:MFS transporter [Natronolimnohabitans innermongolicus]|uniref:Major facilitator superfamily protein n=1 Tax=Natronolimnohabitans innermongolicus JCM 12255 TaxID=1227499 RepID=L9WM49_9EURY|nr:MFS transporter [Natronolimnohabitans innermongolicus]ELY50467.1 major facilitator superfamily protein [Natronolimnohabitans innermongolicus JCM 12255]
MSQKRIYSSIRGVVAGVQADGHGKALLAIASSSFLLIGVQMIYPVVLPELRTAYGLNLGTAGVLLTVLWLSNAAGQVPGGVLADRFGEGRIMVASTVVTAAMVVFIVAVDSIVLLFLATVLLGQGIALFGVARYTALDDLFPNHVGTTVGVVLAAADAGQALLPPLAGVLAAAVVWQLGFAYTLPLFAFVALALWLYVPASTSGPGSGFDTFSRARLRDVGTALRKRTVLYGSAAFIVYMIVWITFTGFYPTYLLEMKDLSTTAVGLLFGSFFAVGVAIKPLSGMAYDRFGIRLSLLTVMAISGTALVVLPFVEGLLPIAIITVLIAPILGSGTITQSHLIQGIPNDIKGTGLGVVRTGGMAIAAVSPAIFGTIADWGYFDEVFLFLAGLAACIMLFVRRIPPGEHH